jgi:hypothetical protein
MKPRGCVPSRETLVCYLYQSTSQTHKYITLKKTRVEQSTIYDWRWILAPGGRMGPIPCFSVAHASTRQHGGSHTLLEGKEADASAKC